VNVVLWKDMFEKNRIVAKTTAFLGVTGKLQVESNVVHVIAEELWRPELSRSPRKKSRDFH
jgi:error-prone DNA polymerase